MSSDGKSAVIQTPGQGQLLGQPGPRVIRAPFLPTAPFLSTDPNVSQMPRYYVQTIGPTYTLGQTVNVSQKFDIPGTVVAWNGACFNTGAGNAFPIGVRPLDTFLINLTTSTRENITTGPVLGSALLGTGENPGQVGAYGYMISAGGTINMEITPLLADLRITIMLTILELRAGSNYLVAGLAGSQ